MNFYIKQLKLWFSTHPQPKSYYFYPDKVNVITGDSSTGKSSILQIIDYCLLSKESRIVEDVINENVSWYGLTFHLNGHEYAIARRAPKDGIADSAIYWRCDSEELPDETPVRSCEVSRASIENFLDEQFHITGITLKEGRNSLTLHFRHMMLFSYLSEDIIASLSHFWDTGYFEDSIKFIPNVFNLAIGTEEEQVLKLQQDANKLYKIIKQEERNKDKDCREEANYSKQLNKLLTEAKSLGIITMIDSEEDIADALLIIKRKVDEVRRLKRSHAKLHNISVLEEKARILQNELNEFNHLQYEYNRAVKYVRELKDSIMPMDFLLKNLNKQIMSDETILLYSSLEETFKSLKRQELRIDGLPEDFEQKRTRKKQEYNKLSQKIKTLYEQANCPLSIDTTIRLVSLEDKFSLLKRKPSTFVGDVKLQEFKDNHRCLLEKIKRIIEQNKLSEQRLIDEIQSYYDLQCGISESYRNCLIFWNQDNNALNLKRKDDYKSIRNIGSKSNYMFMHLCFYFGLHQHLLSSHSNYVPNFLFIDQPSIPYYGNSKNVNNDFGNLKNDDKTKLKAAFQLIEQFMSQNVNGKDEHFQIILIEHANPEYWVGLKHFDTRYQFTEGKDYALIPNYVDIK